VVFVKAAQVRMIALLAVVGSILVAPVAWCQEDAEPLELTLDEAIAIALERNYNLKSAQAAMEEARAAIGEAEAATRFQFDLEGNYTRRGPTSTAKIPGPGGQTETIEVSSDEMHSYGVSMHKSLYSSGRNQAQIKLAELRLDAAEYDQMVARRQVLLAVRQTFYAVLRARGFVEVNQQSVDAAREHWQNAKARYEAGTVPRLDVIRAEVDIANAEQDLIASKTQVDNARASLKRILATDITRPVTLVAEPEVAPMQVDPGGAIGLALRNRSELEKARTRLQMAETSERLADAGDGVNLGLQGAYDRQSASGFGGSDYSWNLSVVLSKSLSDGGLSVSQERQARKQQEAARYALGQLKDQISFEVWQAYLDLQEAKARLNSTAKTIEAAAEALRLSEIRYEAGVATPVEVTDARVALTAARSNHVEAVFGYRTAEAQLISAVDASKEEIATARSESEAQ
jgi:outer membrane protein TolC